MTNDNIFNDNYDFDRTSNDPSHNTVKNKQQINDEEKQKELSLRPGFLEDFVGQDHIKQNLQIFIDAAKKRSSALDHTLFYGPPGLGKTSLASIISKEMSSGFTATSGPILIKAADLAAILTNLNKGDVLFFDEIHRLNTSVEEILYSAMEDFVLDIIIGEGPGARSVRIDLPRFTLIGATTRLGLISNPLRDRFGIPMRLSFYNDQELSTLIIRASNMLDKKEGNNFKIIKPEGALEIAKRSRGTPRIALRLLRRVRDFASFSNQNIDQDLAANSLDKIEVDNQGLDGNDYRYLMFIYDNYEGGPVGAGTIAAGLSEQKDVIEDTIEPYLIQIGFIKRTKSGREITSKARTYLTQAKDKN
ncbi:MAG TPA: Holliday junction branch migration DNA helicase RuvB [Candidatus Megaira endosymbiont of Hartmannula sinica]|nr:Holliday junction branch migration DNA helicase RuvB [Candidatus Megaera endosymbiont of Hartmannula sinica]